MPRTFWIARFFLLAGALLLLLGLFLWHILPVPLKNPPYLVTSVLAYLYGMVCYIRADVVRRKRKSS